MLASLLDLAAAALPLLILLTILGVMAVAVEALVRHAPQPAARPPAGEGMRLVRANRHTAIEGGVLLVPLGSTMAAELAGPLHPLAVFVARDVLVGGR